MTTSTYICLNIFFKWALSGIFLIYFQSFSKKHYKFYNKLMWKNVHPVYDAGIQAHNLQNMSFLS